MLVEIWAFDEAQTTTRDGLISFGRNAVHLRERELGTSLIMDVLISCTFFIQPLLWLQESSLKCPPRLHGC